MKFELPTFLTHYYEGSECPFISLSDLDDNSMEQEFAELAPLPLAGLPPTVKIGRALPDFGFRELGVGAIAGCTVSANARISRLAEGFGAEMVATLPGPEWMMAHDCSSERTPSGNG